MSDSAAATAKNKHQSDDSDSDSLASAEGAPPPPVAAGQPDPAFEPPHYADNPVQRRPNSLNFPALVDVSDDPVVRRVIAAQGAASAAAIEVELVSCITSFLYDEKEYLSEHSQLTTP